MLKDDYINMLENALIFIYYFLDKNFDYYDTLRELSGMGNFQALDFLDRLGSDNYDGE